MEGTRVSRAARRAPARVPPPPVQRRYSMRPHCRPHGSRARPTFPLFPRFRPFRTFRCVPFAIFSGLPGSGKSTLARQLAPMLALSVLDKDDFLDALFEERGVGDFAWRSALSREADARFEAAARRERAGCLVSWWRHPADKATSSGTPTDWLSQLTAPLVEVHCQCDLEIAVERFRSRRRHAGHLDGERTPANLRLQLSALPAGPLGCGTVVTARTDESISVPTLSNRLMEALRS